MSPSIVIFGIYFFASSAVLIVVAALICLTTCAFDKNRRLLHYFACLWGYHYLLVNPGWRCTIEGREHIDPHKTYVLVANHSSYFDILALYGLFRPYKWVSKEEIFKIPFVGWNMMLNQYVTIARGNLTSIKDMLKRCKTWLQRGASILIFPEGTRSETGELQAFRDGAFKLAIDCRVPVVPVVVDGTFQIYPKHAKGIRFFQPVRVRVLPPVEPAAFEGSAKMRDHVHALMQATLDEMRGKKIAAQPAEAGPGITTAIN